MLFLTAGGGCLLGGLDVALHRSPDGFSTMRASNYWSISLPGRLPPAAVHRRALNADPDSRQYRFRALGQLAVAPLVAEEERRSASIQQVSSLARQGLVMGPEDRRWFYTGFGEALAGLLQGEGEELRSTALADIREMAASLSDRADCHAFLTGVVEALSNRDDHGLQAFALESWGEEPATMFRSVWSGVEHQE